MQLVTELAAGLPPVTADPGQVEQVLMNLAANARDAMPRGGRLVIRTHPAGPEARLPGAAPDVRHVCLSVSDTGRGMDSETRAHVFEPFFTTKGPGRGTGLGLATVYGIVTQSGGHITVESAPDAGATFTVYLPVASAPASEPAPEDGSGATGGRETVLLVEDEPDLRDLARDVLESRGYTTLVGADAAEGLRLGLTHPQRIHLVLTDVVMPGRSGREMVEDLRAARQDFAVL